jgi:hypothetical protein
MSKQIVVTFDEEGNATIDAQGFTGSACLDATRALELALNNGVVRSRKRHIEVTSNIVEIRSEGR